MHLRNYNFNWIVTKCPVGVDEETRLACERDVDERQMHPDPMAFMPVTSTATGFTYRNVHCARCHGDTPALRFWNPRLECNSIVSGNAVVKRADKQLLADKVRPKKCKPLIWHQ